MPPHVLALDIEGTLISNGVSLFPRQGLFEFFANIQPLFDEIFFYSSLTNPTRTNVLEHLAQEGSIPRWALGLRQVESHSRYKDLRYTGYVVSEVLIVDDMRAMIDPAQESQWVPIAEFLPPYGPDNELARVCEELALRCQKGPSTGLGPSKAT